MLGDELYMRRALSLAQKAKGTTFPNPAVGAVIVDANGVIVGEGATDVYGGHHAEKRALKKAGAKARGATMYVSLEPCAHFGRTPPCTNEIIKAGISKVLAAVKDPNPQVSGKGLRQLKAHNIDVMTGLLSQEATLINEDFFWAIARKRPWIALKLAMTLDGRIADGRGKSKWITSNAARREVQEIRRRHGAIAVGKNTLLLDDPKLTARCGKTTYYPARIVFSSETNLPQSSYFLTHTDETRTIIVARGGEAGDISRVDNETRIDNTADGEIHRKTVEVWRTGFIDSARHIDAFLNMAYSQGLNSILVEGGQLLASGFLENGFVNKAYLFYGNKICGNGTDGLVFSHGLSIDNPIILNNVTYRSFGDDFEAVGYVKT